MNTEILNAIILAGSFLALFGISEILYHKFKVKAELTRKLVHVGTGLLTLLFPVMLGNHWLVLALCLSFALILVISLKYDLLRSINAIERKSMGSLAFPVSVYGCYLAFDFFHQQYVYFYFPILILAISDPVAALFGKKWPIGRYKVGTDNKTLMGSAMFFLSALLISAILSILLDAEITAQKYLMRAIFIAFIAAVSEAISGKGSDNITVPASVLLSLIISEHLI